MHNEMTIAEWLEWRETPAARDPQRHDPTARMSKSTARAVLQALFYLDFAKRQGYYLHKFFDNTVDEVERAKSIMLKIINSDTEETL